MLSKRNDLLFHEKEHLEFLKDNAHECTLFLKRDDDAFPLKEPCAITLVGNGVRNTVIGGTGSGAVNVRYKENIEEAFLSYGFSINSEKWLDQYDSFKKEYNKGFVKQIKKEAKEHHAIAPAYAMGKLPLEGEYAFDIEGDNKVAIYVLSRNGGEGADRRLEKGDIYLTESEIRDILTLNSHYEKFLLVLNVPGVIDLEPVMDVRNILLLSQLGSMSGEILVNIVLGNVNPCGKLTTTWARIKDYPYISTPIDLDECFYKEGIYVGYRYFSSLGIKPLFPFGYGLSYSRFSYETIDVSNNGEEIYLKVRVTNESEYSGKEVIQAYLSINGNTRARYNLVAFKKTKLLLKGEKEEVTLSFKLSDFPIYDEKKECYLLEKGDFVISIGNSVISNKVVAVISNKEEVTLKKVHNVLTKPDFIDMKVDVKIDDLNKNVKHVELYSKDFETVNIEYLPEYKVEVPEFVKNLSVDELILLSLGDYKTGVQGMIGQSCSLVIGGAGETTLRVNGLDEALNMVDGPAGLRLVQEYIVNKHGTYQITGDSIWEGIAPYLPGIITKLLDPTRNKNKKGSRVIQLATALPIATALAQSFNDEFILNCGRLVKEEMEIYGVDIWLAPALNIHRSILCGRNFEYYSEDPLVSAFGASLITKGVQENKSKVVTIKHYCCNNQESNRLNNNSVLSEKALREIYLLGFEKCIKWSNPLSIMSSYNLVNGVHTSEHKGLLLDVLRNEWGYEGLIMTDWVASGQTYKKNNKYPASYASRNIKNGNNICMPGSKKDIKNIKSALKKGYLSIDELRNNAAVVYTFIKSIKN